MTPDKSDVLDQANRTDQRESAHTQSGHSVSGAAQAADLWGGASGRAARKLPRAASLPDLAADGFLPGGTAEGRCRDLRAHPVLHRDAHAEIGLRMAIDAQPGNIFA
jgi:hypothetical protein